MACGGEGGAKEAGRLRLEGKDYVCQARPGQRPACGQVWSLHGLRERESSGSARSCWRAINVHASASDFGGFSRAVSDVKPKKENQATALAWARLRAGSLGRRAPAHSGVLAPAPASTCAALRRPACAGRAADSARHHHSLSGTITRYLYFHPSCFHTYAPPSTISLTPACQPFAPPLIRARCQFAGRAPPRTMHCSPKREKLGGGGGAVHGMRAAHTTQHNTN